MTLRIRLLGSLQVVLRGEAVTPSAPKLRRMLALLAINHDSVVRLETIAEEVWARTLSVRLVRSVQTYISQLRGLITGGGEPCCTITHHAGTGYRLALCPGAQLDVRRLVRLRELADVQLRDAPLQAVHTLYAALGLCRDEALADVSRGPVLEHHKTRLDTMRAGILDRYLRACALTGLPPGTTFPPYDHAKDGPPFSLAAI